jgi:hypothetical protein
MNLNAALADGQIKLDQSSYDLDHSISITIQTTITQIRDTHPEGAIREDFLSKQFTDAIKRSRPRLRGSVNGTLCEHVVEQRKSSRTMQWHGKLSTY